MLASRHINLPWWDELRVEVEATPRGVFMQMSAMHSPAGVSSQYSGKVGNAWRQRRQELLRGKLICTVGFWLRYYSVSAVICKAELCRNSNSFFVPSTLKAAHSDVSGQLSATPTFQCARQLTAERGVETVGSRRT